TKELTNKELFAPLSGSLILELADGATLDGALSYDLGTVTDDAKITMGGKSVALSEIVEKWTAPLEKVFPTQAECPEIAVDAPLFTERNTSSPVIKAAKPKVFIPVFPGTNCEVDTARAFEKAGAEVEMLIVKNLTQSGIEETIERMEQIIRQSQMIMLPGGFSGGDEPDGSGKFIATTFRNPRVSEAVSDLLNNRDGLMLGICNGFQALIKLGLVPYGEIRELKPTDPTLTFNTVGRHISHMAYTRVTSVKSPWFSGVNAGDVFAIPVSHGEGRFMADLETVKQLAANGQIATQYVDLGGKPSDSIEFNLNGSVCAIEGITSPDGRVLGKMGHSERKGENLYKNVPFEKDQKIFESGVNYFK
ncbi:phosphoribosylformylglycinamidine synthase subunit PurQ, partial [Ruminococcus sp.]|uniref:phosphoribosylformylglycinamidine synthase subunit PurQ n=1 Tax=Ruminococcus sp. TaxID=41978 RepID=UPI002E791790